MNLRYTYGTETSKNDGNVQSQEILPLNVTQIYGYDGLNRLNSVQEGAISQTYNHDRYGNRWVTSSPGITISSLTPQSGNYYDSANNRLTNVAVDPLTGNQTSISPYTLAYDAENRMIAATSASNGSISYQYDGEGRRVAKITCTAATACTESSTNASKTIYVYDAQGELAAEYSDATVLAETRFLTVDSLGSTRLTTDRNSGDVRRFDYLPFGELLSTTNRLSTFGYGSTPSKLMFTGKERNTELANSASQGLDYFGARYFSGAQGRFTSPDAPLVDRHVADPQSWNLYSYVRNNPLAHIDSDGQACTPLNSGSGYCQRAELYSNFDSLVHNKTRFFAAASAATQALANVDVFALGTAGTSSTTRAFLQNTGEALVGVNTQAVGQIMSGQISGSGPALDAKMVHLEQNAVQKGLSNIKRTDAKAFNAAIGELNGLLNSNSSAAANALKSLGGVFLPSDKVYGQVLDGVRKGLGRDINFANQKDREAIGNALVQHVRETGGCVVTDNRAHGCRQ